VGVWRGWGWQEIEGGMGVKILYTLINAKAVQSNLNGYQYGYQNSILDQKRKKPLIYNGFLGFTGGKRGIRTLGTGKPVRWISNTPIIVDIAM